METWATTTLLTKTSYFRLSYSSSKFCSNNSILGSRSTCINSNSSSNLTCRWWLHKTKHPLNRKDHKLRLGYREWVRYHILFRELAVAKTPRMTLQIVHNLCLALTQPALVLLKFHSAPHLNCSQYLMGSTSLLRNTRTIKCLVKMHNNLICHSKILNNNHFKLLNQTSQAWIIWPRTFNKLCSTSCTSRISSITAITNYLQNAQIPSKH